MDLLLDSSLGQGYTSSSQKIRLITEDWTSKNIFCPNCGKDIHQYPNNHPVGDFYCVKCTEDFELKAKKGKFGAKVSAGAYSQMIKRALSKLKPNIYFLSYLDTSEVCDFFVVPKYFFVSEIIEKRVPLRSTARRAGWVGSNILFSKIPKAGHIYYVEDGKIIPKKGVLEKWQKTYFLKNIEKADVRGWIIDIINCIEFLNKKNFTLSDMYGFEEMLGKKYPRNKNIKAKIRQQLQILRDKNFVSFSGKGNYQIQ